MPFAGTAAASRRKGDRPTPPNLYATSLLVLQSAVLKLAANTPVPATRKVYRGFGRGLDGEWFEPDRRGVICGVELAFMSTTTSREMALEYSGVRDRGVGSMFEFEVGAVDCGAQLCTLSQYPGAKCGRTQSRRRSPDAPRESLAS
jgi:hypothetical protein